MLALLLITFLYFTPSILAIVRGAPDTGSVIVINLFFGWTFLGWVISLAMAARSRTDTSINVSVQQGLQPGYAQATYGGGGGYAGPALAPPHGQPAFHVRPQQQLPPPAPTFPPPQGQPQRLAPAPRPQVAHRPEHVRPEVVAPRPGVGPAARAPRPS